MIEEVVVVAHPLSGEGLSQAVDVLQGDELDRKVQTSLGATLGQQPGVHSSAFGAAVGRPIIHGLSGPRVRIMEDRIDTLDVSVTSADHAVTVEPFIAERIEVLKGSSTLLYGSGAIGGVVDVHTGRIPHATRQGIHGGIETRYNDNTAGFTTSIKLNGSGERLAWHVDGSHKEGDDYEIPGFTRSARLQALSGDRGAKGTLPGSGFDSKSGAVGGSYIDDWGVVGFSVSRLDAQYGLPSGDAGDNPVLELEQTRKDFELAVEDPFNRFTSLNIRVGANDYEHQEIEPDGEVATDFANDAWEARAELVYETDLWRGALGLQHTDRRFSALGEEAFLQPVDSRDSGVFWVGERSFQHFDLETGVRYGRVAHDPSAGSGERYSTFAISLGSVAPLSDGWQWALLVDYASRAPVAEELYANGAHLVTGTFERGDTTIDNERALNLSSTLQYDSDLWHGTVTGYYIRFSDFIYQNVTGERIDGLPVVEYVQENARFFGIDLEVDVRIASWGSGEAFLSGRFDFVDVQVRADGAEHLPRTPPMRYGVGLEIDWRRVQFVVDFTRVHEQNDVAALELASDGYNDLAAHLNLSVPIASTGAFEVFLSGRNLTDDEQRIHTSYIKDFAPAMGRTLELGMRVRF